MKVYISGPMTGIEQFNYPLFREVEAVLRSMGFEVLNPARNFGGNHALPRRIYMRKDIENVMQSDMVVFLPNWNHSNGATAEYIVARELEIPMIEYKALLDGFKPLKKEETPIESQATAPTA